MKTIHYQGIDVPVDQVRRVIEELEMLLAEADPDNSDYPLGKPVRALINPRWYSAITPMSDGVLLAFRSPALGWQGYVMPWHSVEQLSELFVRQIDNRPDEPVPVNGMTH